MRRAEPIAGLGGILLLVSLFLPWSGVAIITRGSAGSERTDWLSTANGWQTLAVIDVLLAALALLAIAVPLASLTTRGPAKSIGTAVIASALGWVAVVLVAIRLFDSPRVGAWVALAAALVAWVGSWLSLRDESTPGATALDIPRRAAPAP